MVEIIDVVEGTPAHLAGVQPGDVLVEVNGHSIRDVLDYRFFTMETRLILSLLRGGEQLAVTVEKEEYEDLGLCFSTPLMDEKRSCKNGCIFCFIDQLPKGMRESLYFKDDDTRLSFLHGNYVTLTNLTEEDIDRIIEMRISPINVSVHTTDPDLRVKMMRNKRAGEVLSYLQKIADAGLTIQGQIVLCKGINDGEQLEKSLRDLARYYPYMQSVSVVPVGLTAHREGLYPLEPFTKEDALEVISLVESLGEEFLSTLGTRLVWCGDEWYLKAELPIPTAQSYEEYPQIENGVGMLRSFTEEFLEDLLQNPKFMLRRRRVSIATGVAAEPTIRMLADVAESQYPVTVAVYPIQNDFFGHSITVSGLLTGQDIVAQLKDKPLGKVLLIPQNALRSGEDVFLDDMTVADVSAALGVKVVPVSDNGEDMVAAILGRNEKKNPFWKKWFSSSAK